MDCKASIRRIVAGCIAVAMAGCSGGGSPDATTSSRVPPPVRFVAPEVPLQSCRNNEVISGHGVEIGGMTCQDADRILKQFTTAFTDANLEKTVVDRGNGWRCYQELSASGFSVQEVCWRGTEQVLLFRK